MAQQRAAQAYGNNKVNTASQAELTLMLYEGAVKFCLRAKDALEVKDYETANMKKDMEMLDRALDELRDIRDIWKEIMKKSKGPQLVLDTN